MPNLTGLAASAAAGFGMAYLQSSKTQPQTDLIVGAAIAAGPYLGVDTQLRRMGLGISPQVIDGLAAGAAAWLGQQLFQASGVGGTARRYRAVAAPAASIFSSGVSALEI